MAPFPFLAQNAERFLHGPRTHDTALNAGRQAECCSPRGEEVRCGRWHNAKQRARKRLYLHNVQGSASHAMHCDASTARQVGGRGEALHACMLYTQCRINGQHMLRTACMGTTHLRASPPACMQDLYTAPHKRAAPAVHAAWAPPI